MKITKINPSGQGEVNLDGASSIVNLSLVGDPKPGEYVIVHAGYAIEKLDTLEADSRIEMFEALSESWRQDTPG